MKSIIKYEINYFLKRKTWIWYLLCILIIFTINLLVWNNEHYNYSSSAGNEITGHEYGVSLAYSDFTMYDAYENHETKTAQKIKDAEEYLKEDPENIFVRAEYDTLVYIRDNNIPPYDWRMNELYNTLIYFYGYNPDKLTKEQEKEYKELESRIKDIKNNEWEKELYNIIVESSGDEPKEGIYKKIEEYNKKCYEFAVENKILPNVYFKNWKYACLQQAYRDYGGFLESTKHNSGYSIYSEQVEDEKYINYYESSYKRNEYRVWNDYKPKLKKGPNDFVDGLNILIWPLCLIAVLFFALSLSREYKYGTMKNLLLCNISKTKIVYGKVLVHTLFAFIGVIAIYLLGVVVSLLVFQYEGVAYEVIEIGGQLVGISYYLLGFLKLILGLLNIVFWLFVTAACVVYFLSGEFAILFTYLNVFIAMYTAYVGARGVAYPWLQYIPYYNVDFTRFFSPVLTYAYNDPLMTSVVYLAYLSVSIIITRFFVKKYEG